MEKRNSKDWEPRTLKAFIKQAGYTQRSLAKKLEIPEITMNYWVGGKLIPDTERSLLLARELKISLKTLYKSLGLDVTGIPDDLPGDKDPVKE